MIRALLLILLSLQMTSCSHLGSELTEPKLDVSLRWIKPTEGAPELGPQTMNPMAPILTGDLVVQGNSQDGIGTYTRSNGQRVWWKEVDGGITGGAAAIKERLFFGGSDGQFYSLNIKTGETYWSVPIRAEALSAPLLHEGNLYFITGNNTVFALDGATGEQLWVYPRQDPNAFSIRGGSTPVYKDGVIYVGFSDGVLAALDAQNGSVIWSQQLNENKKFRDIDSSPLIDGDQLFVSGFDDAFYSLDLKSGQILWRYNTGGFGAISSDENNVYFASTNHSVIALSKKRGEVAWQYDIKDGIASGPQLAENMLIVTSSAGPLVFLERASGKPLAHFNPGLGSFSPARIDTSRNEVYFISQAAYLYALDYKLRTRKKSFPLLHGGGE